MSEPEIIPRDRVHAVLMKRDWDEARLGQQTIAIICPLCGSWVAVGGPPNGITYKESHARDHQFIASRLTYPDTP